MGSCSGTQHKPKTHRLDPRLGWMKKACFRIAKKPTPWAPGFLCLHCQAPCFDHGFASVSVTCDCGTVWKRNFPREDLEQLPEAAGSHWPSVSAPRPPIPHLQFAEIAVFSANPKGQFGKYRSLLVLLFEESLKYLTTGLMFDNKGVEFQVLACYPPYGAVEVGTELLLSDFILTRRPLPEVTLSGTGIAALGLERLIPRDNFPVHEGSVYPGQELALPGANVVLWSVAEGSGVVTALTHVKVQELENTRSCALAPAPGTGFVDLSGSQIFAAIRLLGELVARFRLGRRFVVRSGAQFKLGGLQLHICYADPSPSLLTSETNVQVLSSVREYLPPAPRPQMSSFRRPLPVLEDREFSSSAEIICTICQSQLDPGCSAVTLPCSTLHTGHMYHSACIRPWLQDNRNCPMCKLSIY